MEKIKIDINKVMEIRSQKLPFEHNEKTFTWNDIKFSTVYGRALNMMNLVSHLHYHSEYEIFVVESGSGFIVVNDKKYKFSKNTLVIVPPYVDHVRYTTENIPITEMSVFFRYKKISGSKGQNGEKLFDLFDSLIPKDNNIVILKDKYFGEFTKTFNKETESNPILASSLITNVLQTLFLKILRLLSKKHEQEVAIPIYSYTSTSLSNDLIMEREIETYMTIRPNCKLSDLAAHLQMCERNTQRVIKKLFGKNFSDFLADNRLKKAKSLMKTTDHSLSKIAQMVCYNQYASFRKAFISKFGISPSEYKRNIVNNEKS